MPIQQQWTFTDVVSGEKIVQATNNLPDGWADLLGDCHGPKGLYIVAQRMITAVTAGKATYAEIASTPYSSGNVMDQGYTLPQGF